MFTFSREEGADIVSVTICEGSDCLLESQFNQTDLGSLLGYDKVSFQLADNHLHNIEGMIRIGLAHEASDVFVRLCLEQLGRNLNPRCKLIGLLLYLPVAFFAAPPITSAAYMGRVNIKQSFKLEYLLMLIPVDAFVDDRIFE